jgi:hypothetical protein
VGCWDANGPEALLSLPKARDGLLQDIFERDAFRVVFLKPRLCGVLAREDFKEILIANLLVSIDIDRNSHWSFSAFACPNGFFTIRIELANDVAVQCSQHSDPSIHQEVSAFGARAIAKMVPHESSLASGTGPP